MRDVDYYTVKETAKRHKDEPELALRNQGTEFILRGYEAYAARLAIANGEFCHYCHLPVFDGDACLYHHLCVPRMSSEHVYTKLSIPVDLRWEVWGRDNFTCQHCGSRKKLTIDHIFPEVKGGETEIHNLQTLCKSCNSKKGYKS